ncbi:lrr receptor-like serine/threonine-protein kinase fei 2 [Quercus suber]|uniref:Lrr receptor-like serine/threonine-protein kinase fei 2 n=1 Tax=Quercus suber TaxID=58331 RepID=A0AAW0JYM6_QUESU|nr:non-functional pseudokinase ZED1-like [Quercus suber]
MQGIVNALAYLRTSFSKSVIHRDIRSTIIILDGNNVDKLIDFSLLSIPKGELHVFDAANERMGGGAPEYIATGYITEKVDVYIYGVLLLGLLAGWMLNTPQYRYSPSFLPMLVNPYDEQNWLIKIIDPMSLKEGITEEHFLAFAQIALSCISYMAEDRPTIIDAGKQLIEF